MRSDYFNDFTFTNVCNKNRLIVCNQVYNWSSTESATILSSFFWGYTIMQIPSGYIAAFWSAQKLLSFGLLLCGILNILTPTLAHYGGYLAVCACRVGMGLSQSCLLPSIHTLLSKWAPPTERARLGENILLNNILLIFFHIFKLFIFLRSN